MKHAREDYNRIQDPAGLIPEDEPVFLLRGQDILAPPLLRKWADNLTARNGDSKMVQLALDQADAMEEWQMDKKQKCPDL